MKLRLKRGNALAWDINQRGRLSFHFNLQTLLQHWPSYMQLTYSSASQEGLSSGFARETIHKPDQQANNSRQQIFIRDPDSDTPQRRAANIQTWQRQCQSSYWSGAHGVILYASSITLQLQQQAGTRQLPLANFHNWHWYISEELPTSKPDRDNAKAATDLAHMVSYMPPPSPVLAVAATSRHRTTAMSTFSSKILTLIHLRRVANILTHTENAATDLAQMHPPSPLQQQASTEHRYSYVKTTWTDVCCPSVSDRCVHTIQCLQVDEIMTTGQHYRPHGSRDETLSFLTFRSRRGWLWTAMWGLQAINEYDSQIQSIFVHWIG